MNLGYHRIHPQNFPGLNTQGTLPDLSCTDYVTIQSGEIKRLPTDVVLNVAPGFALFLTTSEYLKQSVCELFPAVVVVDSLSDKSELQIAVKNSGRNQINLKPGDTIAKGLLLVTQQPQVEEFTSEVEVDPQITLNRPQRKNAEVKFDLR